MQKLREITVATLVTRGEYVFVVGTALVKLYNEIEIHIRRLNHKLLYSYTQNETNSYLPKVELILSSVRMEADNDPFF